jgi:uncharacterized protein
MSARRPFDSLQFAKSGESLSGSLRVEELPRLSDSLRPDDVAVQYRIGRVSRLPDVRRLRSASDGRVWLTCQLCMTRYPECLNWIRVLPVARNEAELQRWEALDPLLDALVADPALDLAALVEDEILLGMPLVPMHPRVIATRMDLASMREH